MLTKFIHKLIPLQMTKKVMFWIIYLTVIPMLIMSFVIPVAIIEIGKAEQEKVLYALVDRLDDSLTKSYADLLKSQNVYDKDRSEQVQALNNVLQPIVNEVSHSFSDIAMGYYSIELDCVVAAAPNFNKSQLIQVPHDKYPYFNIYKTKKPELGELSNSVVWQGKPIIYYVKPIIRDGKIIGHVWANIKTDDIYASAYKNTALIIIVWLLILAFALALAYRFSKTLHKELRKFADAFISDENLSTHLIPELNPIFDKAKEHASKLLEANKTLQNEIQERINIEDQLRIANRELTRSQLHLVTIFNGTFIGIVLQDLKTGNCIYNAAFEKMLGYSTEELRELSFLDFTYPEDLKREQELYREAVENKADKYQLEKRFIRKDGVLVWARINLSLIWNQENEPEFVIGMAEDITLRKQMEANIELNHRRLEALVKMNSMTDHSIEEITEFILEQMISLTGSEVGYFSFIEECETQCQVIAWSKNLMPNCNITDKPISYSITEGSIWSEVIRLRKPIIVNDCSQDYKAKQRLFADQVPLTRILIVPILAGNEMVMNAVVANKKDAYNDMDANQLTLLINGYWSFIQQKKNEEEKIRTQSEMNRLDRLNLIGQMAAGIGHEVRNPMTTVRGFLQMLGEKQDNSKYKSYYDLMIEEIDRANSIITEFLSLARNAPTELEMQNLNKIINDLYPLLQSDALNSNSNIILCLKDIPDTKLNKKEIHQLILNLVRNGLEAMHKKGTITISTYSEGAEIVLAVKDEGTGIDPAVLDKLGTPFLTTKSEGTGLGLATCFSIASRNNARLEAATNIEGTTFFVKFSGI